MSYFGDDSPHINGDEDGDDLIVTVAPQMGASIDGLPSYLMDPTETPNNSLAEGVNPEDDSISPELLQHLSNMLKSFDPPPSQHSLTSNTSQLTGALVFPMPSSNSESDVTPSSVDNDKQQLTVQQSTTVPQPKLNPFASEFRPPVPTPASTPPTTASKGDTPVKGAAPAPKASKKEKENVQIEFPSQQPGVYHLSSTLHAEAVSEETLRAKMISLQGSTPSYEFDETLFSTFNFLHESNLASVSCVTGSIKPFWSHYTLQTLRLCCHVIGQCSIDTCWCREAQHSNEKEVISNAFIKVIDSYFVDGSPLQSSILNISNAVTLVEPLWRASVPQAHGDLEEDDQQDFISFSMVMLYYMSRLYLADESQYERLVTLRESVYTLRESRGFFKCFLPYAVLAELYETPKIVESTFPTPPPPRSVRAKDFFARSLVPITMTFLCLPQRESMHRTVSAVKVQGSMSTPSASVYLLTMQDTLAAIEYVRSQSSTLPRPQANTVFDLIAQRHSDLMGPGKQQSLNAVFNLSPKRDTTPSVTSSHHTSENPELVSVAAAGVESSGISNSLAMQADEFTTGIPINQGAIEFYFFNIYLQLLCDTETPDVIIAGITVLEQLCETKDRSKFNEFSGIAKLSKIDEIMVHLAAHCEKTSDLAGTLTRLRESKKLVEMKGGDKTPT